MLMSYIEERRGQEWRKATASVPLAMPCPGPCGDFTPTEDCVGAASRPAVFYQMRGVMCVYVIVRNRVFLNPAAGMVSEKIKTKK